MTKTQKTTLMMGLAGAGLWLCSSGIALADPSSDPAGQNQQYVKYLQNKLSLTSDQTQQIQSILSNADSQLGPKPGASASQADRQAYDQKVQQAMQGAKSSIGNVLTGQQKAQYAQLHSQHRGQGQGRANYQWNSSAQDQLSQQPAPNGQGSWHKHHHHRQMDPADGAVPNSQPVQNNTSY